MIEYIPILVFLVFAVLISVGALVLSIIIGKDYKILDSFNEIKKYYEPF